MFYFGYIPSPCPRSLQHVQQHGQVQGVEMWLVTIRKQYTSEAQHKSTNVIDIVAMSSNARSRGTVTAGLARPHSIWSVRALRPRLGPGGRKPAPEGSGLRRTRAAGWRQFPDEPRLSCNRRCSGGSNPSHSGPRLSRAGARSRGANTQWPADTVAAGPAPLPLQIAPDTFLRQPTIRVGDQRPPSPACPDLT